MSSQSKVRLTCKFIEEPLTGAPLELEVSSQCKLCCFDSKKHHCESGKELTGDDNYKCLTGGYWIRA